MLDALPLGTIGLTANGQITVVNAAACRLLGRPADALIGLNFVDLGLVRYRDGHRIASFTRWAGPRTDRVRRLYFRLPDPGGVGGAGAGEVVGARLSSVRARGRMRYVFSFNPARRTGTVEEELGPVLDRAADPILTVSDRYRIRQFNRAAERMFRCSRADLLGRTFSHLVGRSHRKRAREFILGGEPRAASSAPPAGDKIEITCRRCDGTRFTAEGAVSHIERDGSGLHTVILRDVTAQVAALDDARREIDLHRVILDHMAEGMIVYDRHERVIAFNRRLRELMGYPEGAIRLGMPRDELIRATASLGLLGPGDPDEHVRHRKKMQKGRRFAMDELTLPNGTVLAIRRNRLPSGGMVTTFRDVTGRRERAARLHRALNDLQKLNDVQTSILNALPSDIALLDDRGTVVAANGSWPEFARVHGIPKDGAADGLNYLRACDEGQGTSPAFGALAASGLRDVLAGRRALFSMEYNLPQERGERWFSMIAAPVGNGSIHGAVVMHADITEQKTAEARIEESERRLKAIFQNVGDGIVILDHEGRIESANDAAVSMFGRDAAALAGLPVHDLLPTLPFFRKNSHRIGRAPPFYRGELMCARANGDTFPAEFVMSRVAVPNGHIYVIDIRDISEQRTLQEELVQASKLSTLGEMAAGMAHELNQPLSVMRMAADNALMRMENGKADADYLAEAFELISSQAARMGETILNLRVFARREENIGERSFLPGVAADAACRLLRSKLALDSVSLTLEGADARLPARGVGSQFEQVLINLISNAHDAIAEARDRGGRADWSDDHVRVRVEDAPDGRTVTVTVEDTGGGIPEEIRGKIFNPFFTSKEAGKGTGLGLSITYGIVRAMGGTIRADNTDRGARFTITLPVREAGEAAAANGGPRQSGRKETTDE